MVGSSRHSPIAMRQPSKAMRFVVSSTKTDAQHILQPFRYEQNLVIFGMPAVKSAKPLDLVMPISRSTSVSRLRTKALNLAPDQRGLSLGRGPVLLSPSIG